MRYIDADAMKKDLEENYVFVGFADLLNDIVEVIDAQPTADVVERKRGKWNEAKPMSGKIGKVCSTCGHEAYWDSDYGQQLFDWCPYCGAEMMERREEDDGLN